MSEVGKLKLFKQSLTPPLPPPPPPPPCMPLKVFKLRPQSVSADETLQVDENELDFSLKILLSSDVNFSKVFFTANTYLEPQLQDGPKCGLVALSIASSRAQDFVCVDDIFQTALSLGFTKQGEMFSTDSLALLAEKCCSFRTTVIESGLNAHLCCIIKSLLRKCLVLVPYDADFNHSPCCRKGFKAHWAVISGFVIIEESKTESKDHDSVVLRSSRCSELCDCIDDNTDIDLPLTFSTDRGRILISKTPSTRTDTENNFRGGKLYLIGRQGKSRHFGLWPFDDMADSNDNLVSFSTGRSSESYVLPKGGLVEGLKGKAIILEYPVVD